jgi:hypothetical protein
MIFKNTNLTFKPPNECSISSAEALTISKIIEVIKTSGHNRFIIFIDSFSGPNSIKNKNNPSDIASLIQNNLDVAKIQIILFNLRVHRYN